MNPNNQYPPYPKEDEVFVIKPPEKKPLDKKSVFFVITFSLIGLILLGVVLVFALIGSASSLANDYRRLALDQIVKLDKPLIELEPSAVLNKRNIDSSEKTISLSKQSQPSLESVLFVGAWSQRYTQTAKLEKTTRAHYQHIEIYNNDLKELITFDNEFGDITKQEPNLAATVNPANSLTIRSAAGSYKEFASRIKDLEAPSQISDTKKQLSTIYNKKAEIYNAWAVLVEAGNNGGEGQAKVDLLAQSATAAILAEDENFITLFKPSYVKILNEHKQLKSQLAG